METIKIKYFNHQIDKIKKFSVGSWIDLRSAINIHLKAGEHYLIPLGVGMKLPEGYEALLAPRSSTFKNYGIIIVNSPGVIDSCFCGSDDQWMASVYALRDTDIRMNERICQFRIIKEQPEITFVEVDELTDPTRGKFGSTGKE